MATEMLPGFLARSAMQTETEVVAKRRVRKWPFVLGALLIVGTIAFFEISDRLGPGLRQRVVDEIKQRYKADIELKSFDLHLLPAIHATGEGLTLRPFGQTGGPPLISVRKFTIEAGLNEMMSGPMHIRRLRLEECRATGESGACPP